MKLLDDWKRVALRAWSMRLWALATVLGLLEQLLPVLPYFEGLLPARTLAMLSIICGAAGLIARVIGQPAMHAEPAADAPPEHHRV